MKAFESPRFYCLELVIHVEAWNSFSITDVLQYVIAICCGLNALSNTCKIWPWMRSTEKSVDCILWLLLPSISYNVLTCILEDPVLMCCRLARNRLLGSTSCSLQSEADPHQFQKRAIFPLSSLILLPALGWGSSVTAVCESQLGEWFSGTDKLAFTWKCFLLWHTM